MVTESALVGMNNMNIEEPENKLEEALVTTHSVNQIPKVDQSTIPAAELLEDLTTLSADQPQEVELSSVAETAFVGTSNMNTEVQEKLEEAMVTAHSLDQIPDVEQSTIAEAEILEEKLTTHSVDQLSDVEQSTIPAAEILEEELTTLSADQPQDVELSTVVETMKAKLRNFWERIITNEGVSSAGLDMSFYITSYQFKAFITLLSSARMDLSLFKAVIFANTIEGAEATLGIPFAWVDDTHRITRDTNLLQAALWNIPGLVLSFNPLISLAGLLILFLGQCSYTHYNYMSCYKKHLMIEVKVNPHKKGERPEEQGGNTQQEHHNKEVEQSLKRDKRLRFPCASLFRIKCYNIQVHNYMNIPWLLIAVFGFRYQYNAGNSFQLCAALGSSIMLIVRKWRVYRSKNPTGSFIAFLARGKKWRSIKNHQNGADGSNHVDNARNSGNGNIVITNHTRSYASILAEGIVGMGKILSVVWFCFWYYITKANNKHAPAGWFGSNIDELEQSKNC